VSSSLTPLGNQSGSNSSFLTNHLLKDIKYNIFDGNLTNLNNKNNDEQEIGQNVSYQNIYEEQMNNEEEYYEEFDVI
jgi:hypothetical protein